jgi:hypothetical protein
MTTTWELLNDAADIIERGGHTKGTLRDQRGHCAIGALQEAAARRSSRARLRRFYISNILPWHTPEPDGAVLERAYQALARDLLGAAVVKEYGGYVCVTTIPSWNDELERTAAEVVAKLRAVAAIEKARAGRAVVAEPELTT